MSFEDKRFNTAAAAGYLGISPKTLEGWRSLRAGPPYVRLGRRVFYLRDDLDAFINGSRIEPGQRAGGKGVAHV